MKESGYLRDYDADKKINKHRYSAAIFRQKFNFDHGLLAQAVREELESQKRFVENQERNFIASRANFQKHGLEFQELVHNLYKDILEVCLERLVVINEISDEVGADSV